MDTKTKRMIRDYARRISQWWAPRNAVKKRSQVAPALHRCSKCGSLNYEGKSEANYKKFVEQFKSEVVNFDGIEIDHIKPVVDVAKGFGTWDEFFEGLFCSEDNLRALCSTCHSLKSLAEGKVRRDVKKKKAKTK